MKYFKVLISGKLILDMICIGTIETKVINDHIPNDAELVSMEYNWEQRAIEVYFCHKDIGTTLPEGASLKSCMILTPVYKKVEKEGEKK